MKRIITIGREFGAGGGELGRRLAREMNIAYYDRDIILKPCQRLSLCLHSGGRSSTSAMAAQTGTS